MASLTSSSACLRLSAITIAVATAAAAAIGGSAQATAAPSDVPFRAQAVNGQSILFEIERGAMAVEQGVLTVRNAAGTTVASGASLDLRNVAVGAEAITLNGTTGVSGKKAFKTITGVSASATISNGCFIGTGDVLGLPFFLPATSQILGDLEDGVYDGTIDGTAVAGVTSVATSTTGDVRGTYDPGVSCDGAVNFKLLVITADPTKRGVPQYAG